MRKFGLVNGVMSGRWPDKARCWPMFLMTYYYDVTDDPWIYYVWFHYIKRMSDKWWVLYTNCPHYNDVITGAMGSQITSFLDCSLNRLFRRRSEQTPNLSVNGLCEGNLPVTGEFLAQRARKAENISICWRHHDVQYLQIHQPSVEKEPRTCCSMQKPAYFSYEIPMELAYRFA